MTSPTAVRPSPPPGTSSATTGSTVADTRRQRMRPQLLALLVGSPLAALVALRAVWRDADGSLHLSLFDDAMISMSYARTLASGEGLVWFPGAEPVEGITNLAWTMVMAALHVLGLSGSQVAGAMMLISLGTVWCAGLVGRRLAAPFSDGSSEFSFAVVLAVAANLPLLFWALRGMEVGLITMLTLTACWLVVRLTGRAEWDRRAAAALVAVIALGLATRLDFVIVPAALVVWVWFDGDRHRSRTLALLAGTTVAAVVALTVFRLTYYGAVVPNTYHLKAAGVSMTMRLTRGLVVDLVSAGAYLVPAGALIVASWRRLDAAQRSIVRMLVLVAGAHVAYSTWVGGDAWEWFLLPNRYLTPAVVCLSLAAVAATFAALGQPAGAVTASSNRRWVLATSVIAIGPLITVGIDGLIRYRSDAWAGLGARPGPSLLLPALVIALVAGLFAVRVRGAAMPGARTTALGLSLLLVASGGFRITQLATEDGNRFSQLGAELAVMTEPHASVAVGGAGGTQYWSQRPMVDLLGKSDPVVARSAPATTRFVPGHNKFDLDHSLDVLRPDVVAQGVAPSELLDRGLVAVVPVSGAFTAAIPHLGQQVVFVRPGSDAVRWELVRPVG